MWTHEKQHIPLHKEEAEAVEEGIEEVAEEVAEGAVEQEEAWSLMGYDRVKTTIREGMTSSMCRRNGIMQAILTTRRSTWTCGSDGKLTPGSSIGRSN